MRASEILQELSLPKNKWEVLISAADKQEVGHELVGLVQAAYAKTSMGSFVNNIKDVLPSDWQVLDWDENPDVDATIFYRTNRPNETWIGNKIQGIGHDGSQTSKTKAVQKVRDLLNHPGWWVESSDAMRHVLRKSGIPAIEDEGFLKRLMNDPSLRMIDQISYQRKLPDGTEVIETVFGNPVLKRPTQ
jgi:hypothetical protein